MALSKVIHLDNNPANEVDMINSPPHYTSGSIEVLDFIKAKLGMCATPWEGYLLGNIIKYLSRYRLKGEPRDNLAKARFYLDKLVSEVRE